MKKQVFDTIAFNLRKANSIVFSIFMFGKNVHLQEDGKRVLAASKVIRFVSQLRSLKNEIIGELEENFFAEGVGLCRRYTYAVVADFNKAIIESFYNISNAYTELNLRDKSNLEIEQLLKESANLMHSSIMVNNSLDRVFQDVLPGREVGVYFAGTLISLRDSIINRVEILTGERFESKSIDPQILPLPPQRHNEKSENNYSDFNELFIYPNLISQCYKVLQDEGLVGIENNFIKSAGNTKGAIVLWYRALQKKSLVKTINNKHDEIITALLNKEFPGLGLGKGTIRENPIGAEEKHKSVFQQMLPNVTNIKTPSIP